MFANAFAIHVAIDATGCIAIIWSNFHVCVATLLLLQLFCQLQHELELQTGCNSKGGRFGVLFLPLACAGLTPTGDKGFTLSPNK